MNDYYNRNHANFIKSMNTTMSDVITGMIEIYSLPKRMKFTDSDNVANVFEESCIGLSSSINTSQDIIKGMDDSIQEFKSRISEVLKHYENL